MKRSKDKRKLTVLKPNASNWKGSRQRKRLQRRLKRIGWSRSGSPKRKQKN